jgi:TRAP-type C4-dicarboxylate transport system permease small subunit
VSISQRLYSGFSHTLELITMSLMIALASLVVIGVVFRWAGNALDWYDEVASITLAWLTYYGAALGALKRSHIGMPGIVASMPPKYRAPVVALTEVIIIGFFVLLAYYGYQVVLVLEGDALTSLPSVPMQFTQSVIPIGAVLYIIAEITNLPQIWREATGKEKFLVKH